PRRPARDARPAPAPRLRRARRERLAARRAPPWAPLGFPFGFLLELQRELREPPQHREVERRRVLLRGLVVERPRVRLPHLDEELGALGQHLLEAPQTLLGLLARGGAVLRLRVLDTVEQLGIVVLEEVELPVDQLAEAALEDHVSSR